MRAQLPLAFLLVALAGGARAQSPIEIADGRRFDDAQTDVSVWEARPSVQQAAAAARAHWGSQDAEYEEDFRVMGVAEGAFTEAGAQQQAVLYLMSLWPRCCPKMGLAIVEGDRLVRNVAFEGVAQELTAVPDLDGDGRDELALIGEFGMGGQVSRSLTLASFGDGGLAGWGGASVYDGACGAMQDGETAARILALPGPALTVERYTKASCEGEAWEPEGSPEPLELYATEVAYVELPVK